jgi:Zn-dependent membrane protease YugP
MPIIIIGMFIGFLGDTFFGNIFVFAGLILFGLSALFSLITLPTEFDASARALRTLKSSGQFSAKEIAQSRKVLTAAAMTYVVAFLMSLLQFLRFLAILLMNRRRR